MATLRWRGGIILLAQLRYTTSSDVSDSCSNSRSVALLFGKRGTILMMSLRRRRTRTDSVGAEGVWGAVGIVI